MFFFAVLIRDCIPLPWDIILPGPAIVFGRRFMPPDSPRASWTLPKSASYWNCAFGITNIVNRAARSADELTADELQWGGERLMRKVRRFHPRFIAVLGMGAFKKAFRFPRVELGRQKESFEGTVVWILPNPSGINAYYQMSELVRSFASCARQ